MGSISRSLQSQLSDAARLTCSLLMQQHLEGMFHGAGECDGSGVHEEDLVYLVDGVQAVRDDDLGGLRGQLGQNLFEKLLGDGVDIGGGFVEDKQLGTSQGGAHKCNQLLL